MRRSHPREVVERALAISGAAVKNRLLPYHYHFITASHTENILLFKQLNVYRYNALFNIKQSVYEGEKKKEACVLSLIVTLVLKCPCTIPDCPEDRS